MKPSLKEKRGKDGTEQGIGSRLECGKQAFGQTQTFDQSNNQTFDQFQTFETAASQMFEFGQMLVCRTLVLTALVEELLIDFHR